MRLRVCNRGCVWCDSSVVHEHSALHVGVDFTTARDEPPLQSDVCLCTWQPLDYCVATCLLFFLSLLFSSSLSLSLSLPRLRPRFLPLEPHPQPQPLPATPSRARKGSTTDTQVLMALDRVKTWSLVDIGLNLTDKMFHGKYNGSTRHPPDVVEMLARAQQAGVHGALLTGGNLKDSKRVVAMCDQYTTDGFKCLCTVGCHPTRCSEFVKEPDAYLSELETLITKHSVRAGGCVAAIGEIGLDYDRLFFCDKSVQEKYFDVQLDMAEKHGLPLFLHDRNTAGDFERHIRDRVSRLAGGVVHSFTGTKEELEVYLDLGFYIGVNGCSYKTAENLEVVRSIPLDRVMLETDAPWCDIRNTHASRALLNEVGKQNGSKKCVSDVVLEQFPTCKKEKFSRGATVKGRSEPCNMVQILEVLYELHRDDVESLDALQEQVLQNTRQLFPF